MEKRKIRITTLLRNNGKKEKKSKQKVDVTDVDLQLGRVDVMLSLSVVVLSLHRHHLGVLVRQMRSVTRLSLSNCIRHTD